MALSLERSASETSERPPGSGSARLPPKLPGLYVYDEVGRVRIDMSDHETRWKRGAADDII